ncbi:LysR family transcriptional regulator [Burkholderia vietnamiensis]|uniref:Transcriptional regulator, LysR family n=4 Tax=Burkholderiales TaxID=80840 RepID=A4JH04_BURVG|nr:MULTISPECIES: LysR family transcriptional regulator [Burkholderia]ABO55557.1 transcriptional regulator, LysR family [Burkholderia vietnamiensis G4]AJY07934.1 bacterial regulatory helix-turn-helix, lysR family protein [Burkholderia vietnamiensis LMG 10929]AOJ14125.1 LysR family transcriptional regulator [Burkholderia vietnamiensis]AOJ76170.1 LysR family transcriptional regulator [Burkholderia ubonensis]AOK01005.1 LysR family transcriptional regulator [Burkholderia vietnamiensis]
MGFDSRLLSGIGVLSAVIEAGTFARAGEAMGLTQPAVSRAVARLEERVGIRIFNRTARAITLTDEGRRFYETVAPLLAGIEEAALDAGQSKARVRGRLRVNVDGTFGHYVLAPRMAEFLDRYPELSVEISVRDRMGDLVADGFDVAVRFGIPEPSSYRARLLLETRVLTCASAAYIARHGEPLHPRDLADGHRCVLIRDPVTGRPYEWEFHRGNEVVPVDAAGRLTVNDTGGLLGACLGGVGIAQLLELYARDVLADGRLVQLLPEWADETFPLYAYHHASNLVSAKVRVFLDFVRELMV